MKEPWGEALPSIALINTINGNWRKRGKERGEAEGKIKRALPGGEKPRKPRLGFKRSEARQ